MWRLGDLGLCQFTASYNYFKFRTSIRMSRPNLPLEYQPNLYMAEIVTQRAWERNEFEWISILKHRTFTSVGCDAAALLGSIILWAMDEISNLYYVFMTALHWASTNYCVPSHTLHCSSRLCVCFYVFCSLEEILYRLRFRSTIVSFTNERFIWIDGIHLTFQVSLQRTRFG